MAGADRYASRRLASLGSYAFAEVDREVARLRERGIEPIDFGVGDPTVPTPEVVRHATAAGVETRRSAGYPSYIGADEFRTAVSAWSGTPLRREPGSGHRGLLHRRRQGSGVQLPRGGGGSGRRGAVPVARLPALQPRHPVRRGRALPPAAAGRARLPARPGRHPLRGGAPRQGVVDQLPPTRRPGRWRRARSCRRCWSSPPATT